MLGGLPRAWSAPRRVAIVNAASDQAAGARGAAELRRVIADLADLTPIPSGNLSRALEGPLPAKTEIERALDAAVESLERAERHLSSFNLGLALSELAKTEGALAPLAYDPRVQKTLAELNIRRGTVYMGKPDRAAAIEAFRSARLLDPGRAKLDDTAFDPVVLQTYAAAGAARPANAHLEVTTAYDGAAIYVDGRAVEKQPVELAAGWHVVTATFPEHRAAGAVVEVADGQTRTMRLDLWPQSSIERATALRRQLREDGLRAAAQAVAALTASDAVVFVRGDSPGQIDVAVFDQRDGTQTAWRPLQGAHPKKLFASILPPPRKLPIVPGPGTGDPIKPPPPVPWYKQRRWQLVAGSGAAATIAGILVFALSGNDGPGQTTGASLSGFAP